MPHERSSTPVLPFDFSTIALADRKIRFRRELPASRLTSTALCLTSEETVDQMIKKNLAKPSHNAWRHVKDRRAKEAGVHITPHSILSHCPPSGKEPDESRRDAQLTC